MNHKKKTIRIILLALVFGVAFSRGVFAQLPLEHFATVDTTGFWSAIQVDSAMINGLGLEAGDEIAVFDDTLCVGAVKMGTFPVAFSAIRRTTFPDTLEGAVDGHPMMFRLWDKSIDEEILATSFYGSGNGIFGDLFTQVDSLVAVVTQITLNTNPAGIRYLVNGQQYVGQRTFYMNVDSVFVLTVDDHPNVLGLPAGERFRFNAWSNGPTDTTQAYTVPASPQNITAHFLRQYFLTTAESPDEGGNLNPAPTGAWYDSSATATVTAIPTSGWQWTQWTGDAPSQVNPALIPMDAPKSVTGYFGREITITVRTAPAGREVVVDGAPVVAPQTYIWIEGTNHNLGIASPQYLLPDSLTRFNYWYWDDGGAASHSYAVPSFDDTVNCFFNTEHFLAVNSDHGMTMGEGWYGVGSQAAFSLSDTIVAGSAGTRYRFVGWAGGGTGAYAGPDPSSIVTMNNPISETAAWQTQFLVDLVTDHGTTTGGGWYDSLAVVNFTLDSTDVAEGWGTRNIFVSWSGSGIGSYNGPDSAATIPTLINPITETANWDTLYYLNTAENPDVGGDILPTPPGSWYDVGSSVNVSAAVATGYQWAGWSGSIPADTTNPVDVVMDGPKVVTANFGKEADVTIQTDTTGRDFTVDGTPYISTHTFTWIENSQHTISIDSAQTGGTGIQFVFTSRDDGSARNDPYVVPVGGDTMTIFFKLQYQLTLNSAQGTTTGGGWYDAGAEAPFQVDSTTVPGSFGTQYTFTGWTGTGTGAYTGEDSSSTVTMDNPITETAGWQTEYYLTVVTQYGTATGGGWYNAGVLASFSVDSASILLGSDSRHYFNGWTGTGTGSYTGVDSAQTVTMNNAIMEVAGWNTQYFLTTNVNPGGAGTVIPAVPGAWYDSGDDVVVTGTPATGWLWAGWSEDLPADSGNPATVHMDDAKSVTANFGREAVIRIETVPTGRSYTIDGTTYSTDTTLSFIENSQHSLAVTSPQAGGAGIQYEFASWSDGGSRDHDYTVPMGGDTLTCTFMTQYLLSLNSAYGTTTGSGWYNAGAQASFTVDSTGVTVDVGRRYAFTGWTGSGLGSYTGADSARTITMNNPVTETAGWQEQYFLAVNSAHGTVKGGGWYNTGVVATFFIDSSVVRLPQGIRYDFVSWTGSGSGAYSGTDTSRSVTMNNAITETASWDTLYYLRTAENPDAGGDITPVPPGGWYDPGTVVTVGYTVAGGYEWAGWSGDIPADTSNNVDVTMDGPKTVTANFGLEVQITIQTYPAGRLFTVDAVSYNTPQTFTWIQNTQHSLSVISPQLGIAGYRYLFSSWSDGGTQTHDYLVPGTAATVTCTLATQYYLTVSSPYGTPSGTGWYDNGATAGFSIDSTVYSGGGGQRYTFTGWLGTGVGAYTGPNQSSTVTMNNPITETAQFSVLDTIPPYVFDRFPPSGADLVARNGGLEFKVCDDMYGVALSSLDVIAGGITIVNNGVDQTSGHVTIEAITRGYRVFYLPATPFAASSIITVRVLCTDQAIDPNALDTQYSFTTGISSINFLWQGSIPTTGRTIDTLGVWLYIPPDALPIPTDIGIGLVQPPPPLPDTLFGVGPTYTLTPDGLNMVSPHEYIIRLPIPDDAFGSDGVFNTDSLYALLYNASTGQWESLVINNFNTDSMWVEIFADQFGYITLATWTQDFDEIAFEKDARMYNYPNPVNPEENPTVICYQLKKDATVSMKLYDVSGQLVLILIDGESKLALVQYRVLWDGLNRQGVMVANNVYFCVLETGDGNRTIHKIAVLR